MTPRQPSRGDLISVEWVDIAEDPTGDPDHAALACRTSYALYWGKTDSHGVECIVTTTTLDIDAPHQSGWCCYPVACVVKLVVIKKARSR